MPVTKLSAITPGTAAAATDSLVGVRNGTTDLFLAIGSAAQANTGTSGATVPLLSGANTFSGSQTIAITDAGTTTVVNPLTVSHDSSGTPGVNFGTGLLFNAQDSTTADQNLGSVLFQWTTATHASRQSQAVIQVVNSAQALINALTITGGGVSVYANNQNAVTGFQILNNSAGASNQAYLEISNGTHVFDLIVNGANYVTSGIFRADGTIFYTNGAGGLTFGTAAAQPVYFIVNNAEVARLDTSGNLKQTSGKALILGNSATTGLTPGVLAASTNASIVITDQSGQAYRIPCII